ncbi:hypothetical protein GCM10009101_25030 [Brevundimonas lenta]
MLRRAIVSKSLVVVGLATVLTALLVAMLSYELVRDLARERRLEAALEQSHYEQTQILRVFSLMQDAEIGQRGYIVTGNPEYLDVYSNALEQLDPQLVLLSRLLADQPRQAAQLRELSALIALKRTALQGSLNRYEDMKRRGVTGNPLTGTGKTTMDRIRILVGEMAAYEAISFRDLRDASIDRSTQTGRFLAGLMMLFAVLLAVSAFVIWRSLRTRNDLLASLTSSVRRQEALFDSSQDGLMVLNSKAAIQTVNPATERLFGWSAAEMEDKDVTFLIDVTGPADAHMVDRLKNRRGMLDLTLVGDLTGIRKDGSTFPANVSLSPVELTEGHCMFAAVRDISERRRIEEMKTQFVSTVSHELRTPLTSIAGSLGLLAGGAAGQLPEKASRLIGIAHANTQRLVRLINDILDIEKIQSGQMTLDLQPLDLRDVAERSIESVRGMADGLEVTVTMRDGTPCPVRGDADRLIQVVVNLLSNAIKFSPAGGEVLLVVEAANRIVRLSVRDNGPGVPEEFRARIFSKFAQADASDTRAKGGTGLGLAIAREIAERHGGRLWFESSVGEGATFHLDLPLAAGAEDVIQGDGPRLLIVEDDADAAEVLRTMLAEDGFGADVTPTAREGLAAARTGSYSAALVDLQLPDADGIGLIRALRSQRATRDLPVVVVSADVARGRARGYSLEVLDWLEKPFETDRLREAVGAILVRLNERRPLVLLVEDDPDIQRLTASALGESAEVVIAGSLGEAREVLAAPLPDLVVLDLGLPDGSGIELLGDLQDADGSSIPVVVYSAQETDAAMLSGVQAVLVKSRTSLSTLARTVRRLTRKEVPTP